MAKDKLTEYDATAANNTVVGDVNLAENSALPSDMNNAVRELMSHQKEAFGSGTPLYVDQTNNRLGVGTTSPSTPLEVSGTGTVSRVTSSDANVYFALGNSVNQGGYVGYESSALTLWSNSGRVLRVDSDGLKFGSDTAAANALDSYEEGQWTPGFTFGGSASGIVYTEQSGIYTKIGRQVTCTFDIRLSNNGSGSGAAIMTGLPFTVGNLLTGTALEGGGVVTFHQQQGGSHTFMSVMPDDNSTQAQLYHDSDTQTSNTIIGNTSTMRGVFTYFAA